MNIDIQRIGKQRTTTMPFVDLKIKVSRKDGILPTEIEMITAFRCLIKSHEDDIKARKAQAKLTPNALP